MGIPKFARFLISRYPLILVKLRNPRDIPEIDHLYLDINGIIHTVSHNNSILTGCKNRKDEAIYYDVCCTIDRILHMIKPKKLLMISADGVAPRAKMNQQRSRRFRKTDINPKDLENIRLQGLDPAKMFNSDCISAGTEFMYSLSKYMNDFIQKKKQCDGLWSNIQVLLTGSDVPGEGEHKIIEYVRNYKTSSDYVQNTKHCVYGLDADLIMLSLITHEPNIAILREDNFFQKKKKDIFYKSSTTLNEPFEIIFVSILREYLELEFSEVRSLMKFEFNLERIIDDFIFFCFFIGNDFLPNLNTLDIETNALENIFSFYREVLPQLDDYITYHGKIDFKKAEKIFSLLAKQELKSLDTMLTKLDKVCKENEKKKKKDIYEKMKVLKVKRLTMKKELFLEKMKKESEKDRIDFKLSKKRKKIDSLRQSYITQMQALNRKTFKFEEDVNDFIKADINRNIKALDSPQEKYKIELIKENIYNKTLTELFNSDDENIPIEKITNYVSPTDSILQEASKLQRYMNDNQYCSDIKIDDINDSDVSDADNDEINKEVNRLREADRFVDELNDINKVFQEKLVEYYIKDVDKAKAFYYKEKLHFDITTKEGKEEQRKMFHKYLEGLQWVLYYYYRGIKSWRWYYPYHYAPMISDFSSIKYDNYVETMFDNDNTTPYEPFQSLIFILPQSSFNLLPKCYENIPNQLPQSFPTKFTVDYNGKHTPWESIVLIPFLDEQIVLEKEKQFRQLTAEEDKRDSWGESYLYYSNKTYCDPGTIKKEVYAIYKPQSNTLLASNYSKKSVDYTFPTLKTIKFDFSIDIVKIYMGATAKRSKRIAICPVLHQEINQHIIKNALLIKEIFINYPYKARAKIIGFVNYNNYYYEMNGNICIDKQFRIINELKDKTTKDYFKQGISLNSPGILCNVALLKMIVRNNQGHITRLYDERNTLYVPFELTSLNSDSDDFKLLQEQYYSLKRKFEIVDREYDKDSPCVILSNCYYGCLSSIVEYIQNNDPRYNKLNDMNYANPYYDNNINYDLEGDDWNISINKLYNGSLIKVRLNNTDVSNSSLEHNFAHNIIRNSQEVYLSFDDLSSKLSISKWTLGIITSTLNVINCSNEVEIKDDFKLSDYEHWNIGLNIKAKTTYSNLILPGYTRLIRGINKELSYWEFSSAAIDLIYTYKTKFPWVFECLEKYYINFSRCLKFFKAYELFCRIDDVYDKLNQVVIWLANLPIADMKFSTNYSDFLSQKDCEKIEECVSNKTNQLETNIYGNDQGPKLDLNPGYLYQETEPWIPIFTPFEPENWFNLGDRVINIRSNDRYFVPFGLIGTITGVSNDFLEVMFDREFIGGTTCQNRYKSNKGAYVNPMNLINLTVRLPVYLRRNYIKYNVWDFERTSSNYDNLNYWYGMQNTNNQRNLKPKNENKTNMFQKSLTGNHQQNQPIEKYSSSYKRDKTDYNYAMNCDQITYDILNQDNQKPIIQSTQIQSSYIPKKIIQKNFTVSQEIQTYPEGVELNSEMNAISFDPSNKNKSEYRLNRIFKNEDLKIGELYYYGNNKSIGEKNKNVILKNLK